MCTCSVHVEVTNKSVHDDDIIDWREKWNNTKILIPREECVAISW